MGEDKPTACEENEALCPVSTRLSTDVACDCQCVAGYSGITPTREFDGEISACLPPSLNAKRATPEQRAELDALSPTAFNQRVYKFCSDDVAGFLDDLIEQQQRPPDLEAMCMGPRIRCKCTTAGAHEQTPTCSSPCVDRECDRDNCVPLLKVGGTMDATACSCSRVKSCGSSTPASSEPPMCLNRIAAVLRRRANRSWTVRDAAATSRRRRQRSMVV